MGPVGVAGAAGAVDAGAAGAAGTGVGSGTEEFVVSGMIEGAWAPRRGITTSRTLVSMKQPARMAVVFQGDESGRMRDVLRNPSLTVTGALAAAPEVPVAPEEVDEEEQPASSRATPITAVPMTRRI